MPGQTDLQNKYDELTKTIKEQNGLRDSGSDDYDIMKLEKATTERGRVERSIRQAGGTPGKRPPTTKPANTGSQQPTSDPTANTTQQLEQSLNTLRGSPPHPGVRLSDGKVVGGTEKDLKEQLKWRADVEQAEHELTAAQADDAWTQAGGPKGFTDADRRAIKDESGKIDGIQHELDEVNAKIAKKEALLRGAKNQLDGEQKKGGGPAAAGGAAIAVGARLQGELRPLYKQQAAIIKRLQEAQAALAEVVRKRVRTQLEGSSTRVDLPTDRKGRSAVEDAFMRRVYRRLGLPYPAPTTPGILKGLGAPQSSLPLQRPGVVVAAVIILVLIALAGFALVSGRGDSEASAAPDPVQIVAVPDTPVVVEELPEPIEQETQNEVVNSADSAAADVAPEPTILTATAVAVPYACAVVVHSPLDGFPDSFSFFVTTFVVAGVDGPIGSPATLTVDAGGLAPNSAPINGYMAEVQIPIDMFGNYSVASITADGPDGPIPVEFAPYGFTVESSEGPIDGCLTPTDAQAANSDFNAQVAAGMWLGDELVDPPTEAEDNDTQTPEPDFAAFLDSLGEAHASANGDSLFSSLDVASIDRYGEDQCRSYLNGVVGSVLDPALLGATEGPWNYETDDASTLITDAWELAIDVTLGSQQTQTTMHVRVVDGEITWFTDCGTPE